MTEWLIATSFLLVGGLGWSWPGKRTGQKKAGQASVPADISLQAQPLLTEAEAFFYNLLRLAAQDHYLVLAQVPLWCLLDVTASDRDVQASFLKRIALKRVDFVLVHPGTRTAVKVVELDDGSDVSPGRQARNRLVEAVLNEAGIECIRLKAPQPSTVSQLAKLLGIEPPD
ncbi:MAG: DUF2726 domain-containing protein [Nitrospira sp.]|nr:DUF2726 domain-containing protein [Nitrospira sp.]